VRAPAAHSHTNTPEMPHPDPKPPSDTPRHERQSLLFCGLHAVNCVLPDDIPAYSKDEFDELCEVLEAETSAASSPSPSSSSSSSTLLARLRSPHRHLLPVGDYDANVILFALAQRGLEAQWWDVRRPAPTAVELGLQEHDDDDEEEEEVGGRERERGIGAPPTSHVVGLLLNRQSTSSFAWALKFIGSGRHWSAIKRVMPPPGAHGTGRDRFFDVDSKLPAPLLLPRGAADAATRVREVLAEGGTVIRVFRPTGVTAAAPALPALPIDPTPLPSPLALAAEELLAWAAARGADVSRIRVTDEGPARGGLCVWVAGSEGSSGVPAGAPLLALPLPLCLSSTSSPPAAEVDAAVKALEGSMPGRRAVPSTLRTVLRLAFELSRGAESAWAPYLRALPRSPPGLLHATGADAALVVAHLEGLPLARRLTTERPRLLSDLQAVIDAASGAGAEAGAAGEGSLPHPWLTHAALAWAHGMFVSRALLVPDGGSMAPAMVPVMDLCNHRAGALSEFVVVGGGGGGGQGGAGAGGASLSAPPSSTQGESSAAMFDFLRESPSATPSSSFPAKRQRQEEVEDGAGTDLPVSASTSSSSSSSSSPPPRLSLRLGRAAARGSEVCINYGAKDNASLALYYGFTLPGNAVEELDVCVSVVQDGARGKLRLQLAGGGTDSGATRFTLSQHAIPPGLLDAVLAGLGSSASAERDIPVAPVAMSQSSAAVVTAPVAFAAPPNAWDADPVSLAFLESSASSTDLSGAAVWLEEELRRLAAALRSSPASAAPLSPSSALGALVAGYREGLAKVAEESARLLAVSLEVSRGDAAQADGS
jgi:hypothetical protein